jgi:xanthine dehydrogenase accessory factor
MRNSEFWQNIADALENKSNLCLALMVSSDGSGPNRPGAKMAILPSGKRFGTVGGGSAERAIVLTAEAMLAEGTPRSKIITMTHSAEAGAESSGMICSGTQVCAVIIVTPADLPAVAAISDAHKNGVSGCISITPNGLAFEPRKTCRRSWRQNNSDWLYREQAAERPTVYLIGGGHVSLALSTILAMLDFRVVVLDNREGLETMRSNNSADECRVVSYDKIREHITPGKSSYICIMTYGHKYDQQVLEQLAECPLAYLGMMGSEKKIEQIRHNLIERGTSPDLLNRVYMPIGIPIGSNTPEEIAVSIAAQLIAVKQQA